MRKLIMWNMVTLDGFFEGKEKWSLDFHNYGWGEELQRFSLDQSREVGALLFGRVTYLGMASYWSTAEDETAKFMNSVPKVVFSRTLDKADWNNTRLIKGEAADAVAEMKREDGKDLFIFGSAELASSLTRRGLIDEYRLGINPVVLGGGNPLFKPSDSELPLKLLDAKTLQTGLILARYAPADK